MFPLGDPGKLPVHRNESAAIGREILAYLAEHREAQDTLEGIAQWWLLERYVQQGMLTVKAALDGLVARGLVLEQQGKDSRMRYGINRRKRREIVKLLNERSHRS
jgi:Fe2+ or Zn2+ uptake regulation protein